MRCQAGGGGSHTVICFCEAVLRNLKNSSIMNDVVTDTEFTEWLAQYIIIGQADIHTDLLRIF